MSSDTINDIEMDHFGCGIDFLASKSVGPCIGFVVLLDHGQHIFVEHRSPNFIPTKVNLNNTRLCLQNVAKHVSDSFPTSSITTVLILGGLNNDPSHSDFQKEIDDMIQIGAENDDVNQSFFYKEFLCNIKYKDVCFNMGSVSEAETGEANIDLIVDRYLKEDNPIIYIIQNVTKFHGDNLIVGVLIIEIKTNKCQFMVDMSATQDNHNKTNVEINFLVQAINYFRSRAALLGAEEVKNDMGSQLLNDAKQLLKKTIVDLAHQTKLIAADRLIFQDNDDIKIDDNDEDDDEDLFDTNSDLH